jgi:glycosyltransferase involved in cell wall biosynthesis
VERLIGAFDVFHGPDFVLPPTRAATVVTVHDLSFLVAPEFSDPRLVRYLTEALPRSLRRADSIVAVSATVAGQLAERFPEVEDRLFAVPNGVIAPPALVHAEPPRPLVLMVGTIEPRKDHQTLLRAMELVWRQRPDTDLIVLGRPGWLADDIVAAIQATAARRPLRWLNDADDAALERCYASATVAVYPARYEGFGLPVIEAMARGVPTVASDAPALVEVSGGHACHVPIGDVEGFAAAIIKFIDDAALRAAVAGVSLAWSTRFTWAHTAAGTLRAYAAAAARRTS